MHIDGQTAPRQSASQEAASLLREEILALHEDGVFLGAEDNLLVRLGVSRPTLRQAARILEHENLLVVRRGAAGGFFSSVPTADAVARVASVYLRYRSTNLTDLNRAAGLVVPEVARLAAANPSSNARADLAAFACRPEHEDLIGTPRFVRDVVREFGLRLVSLIDNPPIALFYEMLLDLAVSPFEARVLDEPGRGQRVLQYHRELGNVVNEGDSAAASDVTSRYLIDVDTWLQADLVSIRHPDAPTCEQNDDVSTPTATSPTW
jgi:GntR family transcriptional regulator, transcriptional repressor for pyruvate dehydrogenase complex